MTDETAAITVLSRNARISGTSPKTSRYQRSERPSVGSDSDAVALKETGMMTTMGSSTTATASPTYSLIQRGIVVPSCMEHHCGVDTTLRAPRRPPVQAASRSTRHSFVACSSPPGSRSRCNRSTTLDLTVHRRAIGVPQARAMQGPGAASNRSLVLVANCALWFLAKATRRIRPEHYVRDHDLRDRRPNVVRVSRPRHGRFRWQ